MILTCAFLPEIAGGLFHFSGLIQVGVNVPVFLCHSSKKEPSESVRAAGRFSPAVPACPTFVYKLEQRDHFVFR